MSTGRLAAALGAVPYEYAGFRYLMVPVLGSWAVQPLDGQHPAARKEKHKRAALECFLSERKNS